MQGIVTDVEKQHNVQFLPGTNEKVGFMAHSWEPLRCNLTATVGPVTLLSACSHIQVRVGLDLGTRSHKQVLVHSLCN